MIWESVRPRRAYCRWADSLLLTTCLSEYWHTYGYASRRRCSAVTFPLCSILTAPSSPRRCGYPLRQPPSAVHAMRASTSSNSPATATGADGSRRTAGTGTGILTTALIQAAMPEQASTAQPCRDPHRARRGPRPAGPHTAGRLRPRPPGASPIPATEACGHPPRRMATGRPEIPGPPLGNGVAAVDGQCDAGNKARLVGAEPDDSVGDLVGTGDPAEGVSVGE